MMMLAASAALSGCAGLREQHEQHHPEAASAASQGTMGRGGPGGGQMGMMGSGEQMGGMDMKSMCEMHDRMMNAKTPEERNAMMNEHMKNMSPEMRERQIEMMRQQCRQQ
jgi:hypothetical protein